MTDPDLAFELESARYQTPRGAFMQQMLNHVFSSLENERPRIDATRDLCQEVRTVIFARQDTAPTREDDERVCALVHWRKSIIIAMPAGARGAAVNNELYTPFDVQLPAGTYPTPPEKPHRAAKSYYMDRLVQIVFANTYEWLGVRLQPVDYQEEMQSEHLSINDRKKLTTLACVCARVICRLPVEIRRAALVQQLNRELALQGFNSVTQ